MNQLTRVAAIARKVIKYGSITIVVLMVGRVLWGVGRSWWKARHPDPPPPPDTRFGKLPSIVFPEIEQPALQYRLETRTGGLPSFMDQFVVYFMPIKKPSLLAYDSAVTLANRFDFIQEPEKLSSKEYRWNSSFPVPSSLTTNIITGSFVLDRRWQDDPAYETSTLLMTEERAKVLTFNFLSRHELLPEDIRIGEQVVQYLKAEDGKLVSAVSLSKSQFLRVNLFRSFVDEVPVVNPLVDKGLILTVVALQRDDAKQFVRVEYNYFPVEKETFASYPLTPVDVAWQRLRENRGFIASHKGGTSSVVVRDVYIAYYDADVPQQFLQPVYVFAGDDDFVAYVAAVSDEWVKD